MKKTPRKSKEVVAENNWYCTKCDAAKVLTYSEMINHLNTVHNIPTKGLKASKRMLMHLDASTYFTYQFEVTVKASGQDLILINSTIDPR